MVSWGREPGRRHPPAAGGAGGEGAAQAALVGARQSRVLRVGRVRWGKERERKGV